MINLTEALMPTKTIKLNDTSIKAELKRWLKLGTVVSNNDYLTIEIRGLSGYRKLVLNANDIKIEDKKPTKEELLLKTLEVIK